MSTTVIDLIKNRALENAPQHRRPPMFRRDLAYKRLAQSLAKNILKVHSENFEKSNTFTHAPEVVNTCPFSFSFNDYPDKTPEQQWEYNIAFRDAMNAHWRKLEAAIKDFDQPEERKELEKFSKWVVEIWGRILRNEGDTIGKYVKRTKYFELESGDGMSSFSKILSAKDRHKYQVYDARVANCLNILQLKFFAGTRYYFDLGDTRNNKIKQYLNRFPKEAYLEIRFKEFQSWPAPKNFYHSRRYERNPFVHPYRFYLDLVNLIAVKSRREPIEIEMMLFSYSNLIINNWDAIECDFETNRKWVNERGEYWRARRLRLAKERFESAAS